MPLTLPLAAAMASPIEAISMDQAQRWGTDRDAAGLERLVATGNRDLLDAFTGPFFNATLQAYKRNGKRPEPLPADIEDVIVRHFAAPDPWVGYELTNLIGCMPQDARYRSRALFDLMAEQLRARNGREPDFFQRRDGQRVDGDPPLPIVRYNDAKILCTDQPGIEEALLDLLRAKTALSLGVSRRVIEFMADRHYGPASRVLDELLAQAAPNAAIAREVDAALVALDTPESTAAVIRRLARLRALPQDAQVGEESKQLAISISAQIHRAGVPSANKAVDQIEGYYEVAPPVPAAELTRALAKVGTREAIRAMVRRLAWLSSQEPSPTITAEVRDWIDVASTLAPDAPLDFAALKAALPAELSEDMKTRLLNLAARRDETGPAWNSNPIMISRSECAATADISYLDQRACFGVFHGRHDILEACASQGVDFNRPCPTPGTGYFPLYWAAFSRDEHALRQLLHHGADPRKGGAVYALTYACAAHPEDLSWCRRVLKELLESGAKIDEVVPVREQNPMGMTSLLLANFNHPESAIEPMLSMLLESGADINATDLHGCTPLNIAVTGEGPNAGWPSRGQANAARIAFLEKHHARKSSICEIRRVAASAGDMGVAAVYTGVCMLGGCTGR